MNVFCVGLHSLTILALRPGSLRFLSAAECRLNVKIQVNTQTNTQRASCRSGVLKLAPDLTPDGKPLIFVGIPQGAIIFSERPVLMECSMDQVSFAG